MPKDPSTIPVTIGLDVLEALVNMASPLTKVGAIYLQMAKAAASAAGDEYSNYSSELTDCVSDPLISLEPPAEPRS